MKIVVMSAFPAERMALHALLTDDGHHVTSVATRSEGLSLALTDDPAVMIVDTRVVGYDCPGWIHELACAGRAPRVIFVCSRSRRCDGIVCLVKPIDLAQLRRHIAPQLLPQVA